MIVRTQDVKFTIDRKPQPRRVKLGFEGDNAVERLRFALPDLGEGQTATLMMSGAYANAVTLEADEGRWSVDLTAEVIGKSGEVAAYVRTENGGDIWQSDVIMLETGKVPDAEGDIEQRYPTAVGQMLTAMAEHSVEMEEQVKRAEDAADRAEAAGGGGGGTVGPDGEDGGYYQPSVSADGDLSWSASKPDMPGVETVNIRGPVGPEGQPGRDGADAEVTADNIAAALGYTPADAGDVRQLSEEKANKKDIPEPYILPVATADTLGGVVVSDDFVMDGKVLKAKPEGKYEILHEYTVEADGVTLIRFDIPMCKAIRIEYDVPPNPDGSEIILPHVLPCVVAGISRFASAPKRTATNTVGLRVVHEFTIQNGGVNAAGEYMSAAATGTANAASVSLYSEVTRMTDIEAFNVVSLPTASGSYANGTHVVVKGVRVDG